MTRRDGPLLLELGIVLAALLTASGCRSLVHEASNSSTSLELIVPLPTGTVVEAIRKTFDAGDRRPGSADRERQDPLDLLRLADESDPLFVDYG